MFPGARLLRKRDLHLTKRSHGTHIALLASAYGALKLYPPQLFRSISELIKQQRSAGAGSQESMLLCWSLAKLQHHDLPAQLLLTQRAASQVRVMQDTRHSTSKPCCSTFTLTFVGPVDESKGLNTTSPCRECSIVAHDPAVQLLVHSTCGLHVDTFEYAVCQTTLTYKDGAIPAHMHQASGESQTLQRFICKAGAVTCCPDPEHPLVSTAAAGWTAGLPGTGTCIQSAGLRWAGSAAAGCLAQGSEAEAPQHAAASADSCAGGIGCPGPTGPAAAG